MVDLSLFTGATKYKSAQLKFYPVQGFSIVRDLYLMDGVPFAKAKGFNDDFSLVSLNLCPAVRSIANG
jgi:hypothetical protein